MFLASQWWSCTAPNVRTCTPPSHRAITTQTAPTSDQDSLTCCSWFIRNTDPSGQPTSSLPGIYKRTLFPQLPVSFVVMARIQTLNCWCCLFCGVERILISGKCCTGLSSTLNPWTNKWVVWRPNSADSNLEQSVGFTLSLCLWIRNSSKGISSKETPANIH